VRPVKKHSGVATWVVVAVVVLVLIGLIDVNVRLHECWALNTPVLALKNLTLSHPVHFHPRGNTTRCVRAGEKQREEQQSDAVRGSYCVQQRRWVWSDWQSKGEEGGNHAGCLF
jgi:hypothetical protein